MSSAVEVEQPAPRRTTAARRIYSSGKCAVCRHPERWRVELLKAGGASLDALAAKFDVSRDSVDRHWHRHVTAESKATYLGSDGIGYVLADKTCKLSPNEWGRVAVKAYEDFKADRIIAERNFGGAMVEHVIRTVDRNVSYREVTASRGKIARAEPVSALYEQNRIRHAGAFSDLEDQMAAMTSDGYVGDGSPDRCDALVWALTELMVTGPVPMTFAPPIIITSASSYDSPAVRSGPEYQYGGGHIPHMPSNIKR